MAKVLTSPADISQTSPTTIQGPPAQALLQRYQRVRQFTETLAQPLAIEDFVIQSMPDVSPAKWHLAHTSWFYERFILNDHVPGYQPVNQAYYYLFNSYYNGAGPQHCRPSRGLLSRPTVDEVYDYRHIIDQRMGDLLSRASESELAVLLPLVTLGLNHEQQHQELLLTDIKHVLSSNPLLPAYQQANAQPVRDRATADKRTQPSEIVIDAGVYEVGCNPQPLGQMGEGFCFDNESPRHRVFLERYAMAARPVTNGEYLAFIEDGGYSRPELWLSLGFAAVQQQHWQMPIYWYRDGERWMQFTMHGPQPLDLDEPVCHVSYFEADAFARWRGERLPTEMEWEVAFASQPMVGNFADSRRFHPQPLADGEGTADAPARCFGDTWEWTSSHYSGYPGFRTLPGTLGEYNGKFMCNQFVLRGGSCATSREHLRPTYRNFFPPDARWQFAGIRLARDV